MHIQRTLGIREALIAFALVVALALMSFSTTFAQTTGTSGSGTTYTNDSTGSTGTTGTTGTTDTSGTGVTTPSVPNTGAGGSAATTFGLLAFTAAVALGGSLYLSRIRNA
jgi:hypothetical protein